MMFSGGEGEIGESSFRDLEVRVKIFTEWSRQFTGVVCTKGVRNQ